jgi:hypothetical protein
MDSVASQASNRSTGSLTSEQPLGRNFDLKSSFFFELFLVSPQGLSATIINMNSLINERHISFAINRENDSNESHHTAIVMNDDDGDENPTTGFSE